MRPLPLLQGHPDLQSIQSLCPAHPSLPAGTPGRLQGPKRGQLCPQGTRRSLVAASGQGAWWRRAGPSHWSLGDLLGLWESGRVMEVYKSGATLPPLLLR